MNIRYKKLSRSKHPHGGALIFALIFIAVTAIIAGVAFRSSERTAESSRSMSAQQTQQSKELMELDAIRSSLVQFMMRPGELFSTSANLTGCTSLAQCYLNRNSRFWNATSIPYPVNPANPSDTSYFEITDASSPAVANPNGNLNLNFPKIINVSRIIPGTDGNRLRLFQSWHITRGNLKDYAMAITNQCQRPVSLGPTEVSGKVSIQFCDRAGMTPWSPPLLTFANVDLNQGHRFNDNVYLSFPEVRQGGSVVPSSSLTRVLNSGGGYPAPYFARGVSYGNAPIDESELTSNLDALVSDPATIDISRAGSDPLTMPVIVESWNHDLGVNAPMVFRNQNAGDQVKTLRLVNAATGVTLYTASGLNLDPGKHLVLSRDKELKDIVGEMPANLRWDIVYNSTPSESRSASAPYIPPSAVNGGDSVWRGGVIGGDTAQSYVELKFDNSSCGVTARSMVDPGGTVSDPQVSAAMTSVLQNNSTVKTEILNNFELATSLSLGAAATRPVTRMNLQQASLPNFSSVLGSPTNQKRTIYSRQNVRLTSTSPSEIRNCHIMTLLSTQDIQLTRSFKKHQSHQNKTAALVSLDGDVVVNSNTRLLNGQTIAAVRSASQELGGTQFEIEASVVTNRDHSVRVDSVIPDPLPSSGSGFSLGGFKITGLILLGSTFQWGMRNGANTHFGFTSLQRDFDDNMRVSDSAWAGSETATFDFEAVLVTSRVEELKSASEAIAALP